MYDISLVNFLTLHELYVDMREYSKKINLIQITNTKIEHFNELAESLNTNTVYTIENVDINVSEVQRLINDLDLLAKHIEDEALLNSYLETRHYLDKLAAHIRKTNELKQQNKVK